MQEQLRLLQPDDRGWRLDEHTREIGRQGLQEARAALRRAVPAEEATGPRRRLPDRPRPHHPRRGLTAA